MRTILAWMEEHLLADYGLDENMTEHARRVSIGEVERLFGAKLAQSRAPRDFISHLGKLRELGLNFRTMDGSTLVETMTTSHFPLYFGQTLSRRFQMDYQYQRGQWPNYVYMDTTPDFRDVDRLRMTEPETLKRRREKAEAKPTYISESEISYGVEEFARQFDVSWQVFFNDDLGKIRETPDRMLRAALRFEDSFVSNLYDNATTQATLAGLGAPWSGTGRLTEPNLEIGVNAFAQRTDASSNRLQVGSLRLVVPPISVIKARKILEAVNVAGSADNDPNVVKDYISGVYVDPYMATSGADVPWYLFANPAEIPAVTVARLQGAGEPWVAMKRSDIQMVAGMAPAQFLMGNFATGDIEWVVEDIIGGWDDASYGGVTDFRGIYYSSGTTP